MEKSPFFFVRKLFYHTFAHAKNATDSVAQLVEHIPFKDGVLGSNPSWITEVGVGVGVSVGVGDLGENY